MKASRQHGGICFSLLSIKSVVLLVVSNSCCRNFNEGRDSGRELEVKYTPQPNCFGPGCFITATEIQLGQ